MARSICRCLMGVAVACAATFLSASAGAQEPSKVDQRQVEELVSKGVSFLSTKGQADDGSFSSASGPGVTALITTSLLRSGRSADDPIVSKSLKFLKGFIRDDGGIYQEGSNYRNYETCLAMMCFAEANGDGRYADLLKAAEAFVNGMQWDEGEGKTRTDMEYGGGGYGRHKRPDLSNTSFMVDALVAVGNDADSEAIQRALIFVSRCQNLETEHNTTPFAAKNPDGGFYYTPAAGGVSEAGPTENGGLRSYASMTYAGLKSMIYAGVKEDDPRVKGAVEWIAKHYDLTSNPGMGDSGLYYYYHTFAKALDAMGEDVVVDEQGNKHNWRAELVEELARRQSDDGSWVNTNSRWLEGDSNLATGYALLALSYCRPKAE